MRHVTAPIICATCELEILGSPTIHQGLPFCCAGCAGGGPCNCSYDPEPLEATVLDGGAGDLGGRAGTRS
jgi:hypothetical protein